MSDAAVRFARLRRLAVEPAARPQWHPSTSRRRRRPRWLWLVLLAFVLGLLAGAELSLLEIP